MNRLARQSFLGVDSDIVLSGATIGIVGLGGGGSHLVQQFAHLGIGRFVLVDPDTIDLTNTNRLIGGTLADVTEKLPKVEIAERLIKGLQPNAHVKALQSDWRHVLDELKECDVLLGAVDSFKDRDQLERFSRRFLIHYIDVGMDVLDLGEDGFLVNGQVILSSPGCHCLRCCNFITDDRLAREAEKYGAAGNKPQVVWANGVLASTAVGLAVELLSPWYKTPDSMVYLEYDGNRKSITASRSVAALTSRTCNHYLDNETGDPAFDVRQLVDAKPIKSSRALPVPDASLTHTTWWRRFIARFLGK